MNRRQLEKLTFANIDQYRDKIVDMQSHLGKLWIVCLRMKGRNIVRKGEIITNCFQNVASVDHLVVAHFAVAAHSAAAAHSAVAAAAAHSAVAAHSAAAHSAVAAHSSRSKEFDGSSLRIPFFLRAISSLHSPFPTSKSSSISTSFSL